MPHKPEDHDKWKVEKERKRAEYNKNKGSSSGNSNNASGTNDAKPSTSTQKLRLSDKMKAVLMTQFNCCGEEAKNVVGDICKDLN